MKWHCRSLIASLPPAFISSPPPTKGRRNAQFAFRALGISDEPPLLLIGIQENNFSREMIQKSSEFVINVCSENQLHAVNRSRELSGRNVEDKFLALGLETIPAKGVKAPLVAGCHANVECRVVREVSVDGLFLFVGEALAAHLDDKIAPVSRLAGKTFRLGDQI